MSFPIAKRIFFSLFRILNNGSLGYHENLSTRKQYLFATFISEMQISLGVTHCHAEELMDKVSLANPMAQPQPGGGGGGGSLGNRLGEGNKDITKTFMN